MASVYFRDAKYNPKAHSKYWQAKMRGPNGKQLWLTTKLTKEDDALTVAKHWEAACLEAENKQFNQKKGDDLVQRIFLLTKCTATKKVTAKLVKILIEASTDEDSLSFQQFCCDKWLKRRQPPRLSPSTFQRYQSVVHRFLDSLPERRRTGPIDSITVTDVQNFAELERDSGKSPSTVRVNCTILSGIFHTAQKQQLSSNNPCTGVEFQRPDPDERKPFDEASVRKLLAAATPEWKGMILFGFQAGLRLSDAAGLTWANIDLQSRLLTFIPKKGSKTKSPSKRGHTEPLHDDLCAYLESLPASDDPNQALFPTLKGARTSGHNGLSNQFSRLMVKAGIQKCSGQEKHGAGRRFNALSFHSLRHGIVTRMTNAGVSPESRMLVTGHSSKAAHQGYSHPDLLLAKDAVAKLGSVL